MKAGTGQYGIMHNVEVWGKWVCGGGLKRRGVRLAVKWVWEEAVRRHYGFMHNVEVL